MLKKSVATFHAAKDTNEHTSLGSELKMYQDRLEKYVETGGASTARPTKAANGISNFHFAPRIPGIPGELGSIGRRANTAVE